MGSTKRKPTGYKVQQQGLKEKECADGGKKTPGNVVRTNMMACCADRESNIKDK